LCFLRRALIVPTAGASPEGPLADFGPANMPIDPSANFPSRAILDKKMLHLPDWSLIDLPEHELKIHRMFGASSALFLPLLREGECIGLLALVGKRPNSFGPGEIAQAESFRDQALIAIENARLFNEINGPFTGRTDQQDSCGGRYQRPAGAARAYNRRGTRQPLRRQTPISPKVRNNAAGRPWL
jgi:hypothetical protein